LQQAGANLSTMGVMGTDGKTALVPASEAGQAEVVRQLVAASIASLC